MMTLLFIFTWILIFTVDYIIYDLQKMNEQRILKLEEELKNIKKWETIGKKFYD